METITRTRLLNYDILISQILYNDFIEIDIFDLTGYKSAYVKLISLSIYNIPPLLRCNIIVNGIIKHTTHVGWWMRYVQQFFYLYNIDVIESITEVGDTTTIVLNEKIAPNKGDIVTFTGAYRVLGNLVTKQFVNTGGKEWRTLTFTQSNNVQKPYNNISYNGMYSSQNLTVVLKPSLKIDSSLYYVGKCGINDISNDNQINYGLLSNSVQSFKRINLCGSSLYIGLYDHFYDKFLYTRDLISPDTVVMCTLEIKQLI